MLQKSTANDMLVSGAFWAQSYDYPEYLFWIPIMMHTHLYMLLSSIIPLSCNIRCVYFIPQYLGIVNFAS